MSQPTLDTPLHATLLIDRMFSPFFAAAVHKAAQAFVTDVEFITNSILVTIIVSVLVLVWARKSTRNMQLIPSGSQNLFEAIVEGLYETLEGIVGPHVAKRAFSLLASLFLFILASNWFGLFPGVGSIGWGEYVSGLLPFNIFHLEIPILRPTTADLNMTLALSAVFMVMWLYWSISEMGAWGSVKHIFGVKGGLTGIMALILTPIFLFVGLIEIISIIFRPVSLSLRLYGNVYAGESLLVSMLTLGTQFHFPQWLAILSSIILPIPFYFLELLIGLLQALVFMLLCAVYIQLSTSHDDDH